MKPFFMLYGQFWFEIDDISISTIRLWNFDVDIGKSLSQNLLEIDLKLILKLNRRCNFYCTKSIQRPNVPRMD